MQLVGSEFSVRDSHVKFVEHKKTSQRFEVLVSVLRSVARRRLVETGNPSMCTTVNCKVCKSATALYLNVIKRTCKQGANKSNHPK
jgi:hypothetical protein